MRDAQRGGKRRVNATALQIDAGDSGIRFAVYVQPRASRNEVTGVHDGALRVRLKAPPVEGAANRMCLKFLGKLLDVPKSSLEITAGQASRRKRVLYRCPPGPGQTRELARLRRRLSAFEKP